MFPSWMTTIAMAITTAARTLNTTLKSAENLADTAEAYTDTWKQSALKGLADAKFDDDDK